jgi:tRNA(Ile)-lysidine synthase
MPLERVHLRPLLTLSKAEIVKTLEACGATWREDASNAGRDYFRTRVRRDVIPAWRKAAGERDAIAGAALSRELIEEDDEALSAWVDEIAPVRQDGSLNLRRLRGKPRAVVRRALHLWLARQRKPLAVSRQCFAALLQSVMAGRITRHSIGTRCFAEVGKSRLVLREVRQKDGG